MELASSPRPGKLTDATEQVYRLPWNDPEALRAYEKARGDSTAALVVNPLD